MEVDVDMEMEMEMGMGMKMGMGMGMETDMELEIEMEMKMELLSQVEKAKEEMRREEMWRERWARITVPDRALTIGTLRYAHVPAPHLHEQQVRAAPSQSPYDSGGAEQSRGVCFTGGCAAGGGAVAPGQHARREATAHRRQQGPRWGAYDEGDGEFRLEAGERVARDVGLG